MKAAFLRARPVWWLLLAMTAGTAYFLHVLRTRELPARPLFPPLAPLTASDRILILAPHEDDEALATGGLLQQAVAAGAAVRVVYLTNGDHNQLAFLLYRKRPWLTPADNRRMGEVRRREAIAAMAALGIHERDLVFLGYPDHDTLSIWTEHWGDSPPLLSILTGTRSVPYGNAVGYGKPYRGESIVADLERQVLDFHPTRIFVSHPMDGNPDHRAYYLFLRGVLLGLQGRVAAPVVYTCPVHMGPWPRPRGYHPDEWLPFPKRIECEAARAWILKLTPDQVRRKHDAICLYRSQMTYSASWLTSFARRNEIFIRDEPIPLGEGDSRGVSRRAVASADTSAYETDEPISPLAGASFSRSADGMVVTVAVRRALGADMGLSLFLFGCRRGKPFADMPKLSIEWFLGSLSVKDRGAAVRRSGIRVKRGERAYIFTIPWAAMGNPTSVFAQVRGAAGGVATSYTGWQVFTLEGGSGGTEDEDPAVPRG